MDMEPDDELPDPLDDEGDPLGFDPEDGEGSASFHSDSVVVIDEEETARESFLETDSHALDELIERTAFFTDEVAYVDADPQALDAAAGIRPIEAPPPEPPPPAPIGPTEAELAEQAEKAAAARRHLRGLVEALLFVSERPMKAADIADVARADIKEVRSVLEELSEEYREHQRGFQLDELAGGWQLRTSAAYAPFVRELTQAKPVRLSRAQVETLAIIAYRQPITRPEIEDIRGVDAGAVLKLLLDRDMIRILGKKDEPGRPLLYGTTGHFLTFFGLKSLKDLPTLREFTELTEESREVVERELGEVLPEGPHEPPPAVGGTESETVVTETASVEEQAVVEDEAPAPESEEAHVAEQPEPENDTDEAPEPEGEERREEAAPESHKPGGSTYDPSDEELFPDDEDEDEDEDDEDDEDEDEENDEEEDDE